MSEYIAEVVQSQYGEATILEEKLTRCKDCKYFERRSIYHYGLCDNGIVCFSVGTFFGILITSLCVVASDADDEMDKTQK